MTSPPANAASRSLAISNDVLNLGDATSTAHPHSVVSGGVVLEGANYYVSSDLPADKPKFPRLSRPVPMMRPVYDVVVVGSGYGGGVAGSRMARAGKSVAILEMGKEKWPGEYPSNLVEALSEVHVSGNLGRDMGAIKNVAAGKSTGLYHLIFGEGQNAFVANGLGGTSLLNANVFLEADKRTLALSEWPPELCRDTDALTEYYARSAHMLQPSPYPDTYPTPKKLTVLEKQAAALGQSANFSRVPQTTFFEDAANNVGVDMKASTGSGQDCTGVNDGSKNSVLMNYIPDAWNWGAEIFCECEVRYVHHDPQGNGYIVFYAWHGDGRDKFKDSFYNELMWVRARELCFLGAGALGTTEILLRSCAHGLKMSPMVGQKLSGNGDVLAFAYNTDQEVNGIGREHPPADNPTGPTITGVIDNRGPKVSPNVLDGYVIEEGAIPSSLAPVLQTLLESLPGKRSGAYGVKERLRHLQSRTEALLFGPYSPGSSVNRTQTYLIMSHDNNEAVLKLQNDQPYLQFLGVGRTERVKKLNDTLVKATEAIGGTLIPSPFYAAFNQKEEITVHPLGGAIMSSDGTGVSGGTNHLGQVFTGQGSDVYEGLVCVDGSVIPTALGVNPLATITALAERSVHFISLKNGWEIDLKTKNGRLDLFGEPKRSFPLTPDMIEASKAIKSSRPTGGGVRFTEVMDGHIYIGADIEDFAVAENVAKGASSSARFYLSVDAYSVETLIERRDHASLATGTFSCGALSKHPLLVLRGEVQFFTPDQSVSDGLTLAYKLTLLSTDGQTYLLNGYKEIDSSVAFSVSNTWKATTTLYTTLTKLDGTMVGRGKLYISWRNFEDQIKSFAPTATCGISSVASFLGYFTQNTLNYFLGPLRKLEYPQGNKWGYLPKVPPVITEQLVARDGVETTIRVWAPHPGSNTSGKPPILMVPGASVDHQIYALPTINVNTVEYLTKRGYVVYVLTPRFGLTPTAKLGYTAVDTRLDVLAAMEFVRAHEEGRKMYIVAHCVGAIATSIGLLDGTLPVDWIMGMTISQVAFRMKFGRINQITGGTTALTTIYRAIAGPWYPISPPDAATSHLVDQLLRFYPVGSTEELCNSAMCHRCSLPFGRLWTHSKLNRATHAHIENFFNGVHMNFQTQLVRMGEAGRVLDNEFKDVVLNHANLGRLEGMPILFISGGANVVFDPESTSMCYDMLRERFPGQEGLYRRRIVPDYGHLDCWMGKEASKDVYPLVGEHLEWCTLR